MARRVNRGALRRFSASAFSGLKGTLIIPPALRQYPPFGLSQGIRGMPMMTASSLRTLREEAAHCRACPLWKNATQTVFGEGPAHAQALLVGEQPGDKEDLAGKPFVGPAGQMLDRALVEAGIDRKLVYVTNAVKHFKFVPRGKIRLHQKPSTPEIRACRPWYERERAGACRGNGRHGGAKRARQGDADQQEPRPPHRPR